MADTTDDIRTNILLVDDRPENLVALEAILEPLGQNLVLAHSGREALKCVLNGDFAVILLDVLMPELDGFETATLIKQRDQSRYIPIIFLTAVSTHEQYVFHGYTVGAVDYLTKPFDPAILRSKVLVFVDLYRKNEQIKRQAALLRAAQEGERVREIARLRLESEQRYQHLAESLPQIIWTTGLDGSITYCNRPWFDPSAADRAPWRQVIHADHLPEFERQWQVALDEGKEFEIELRLRHGLSTEHRWHQVRVLPEMGNGAVTAPDNKKIVSWIVTCSDIDDRRRAEGGLRFLAEASTLLAASLDFRDTLPRVAKLAVASVADWCIIELSTGEGTKRELTIAHSNPEWADRARKLERDALQAPVADEAPNVASLEGRFPGGRTVSAEVGRWCELLDCSDCIDAPLIARGMFNGRVALALSGIGRRFGTGERSLVDDLARKIVAAVDNAELYENVQQERARLEKANRAKDEFLAMVSHELRTPLNAVLGWTQLLRSGELDVATAARGLETIERNARSQTKLIGDILDVSRIISGKLTLHLSNVDLTAVVRSAVDSVQPEARARELELKVELAPLPLIAGDADRLQQVAWNLLSNAIKFTPKGGRIEVRSFADDAQVGFAVADTGVGINADFVPRLFEPFSQVDTGPTRSLSGLGLGLSIVRSIVVRHGGNVRMQSEGEGRGTTMTVTLPLTALIETRVEPEAPLNKGSPARDLGGVRVLLVEDIADGRECLDQVLTRRGARVVAVSSAAEALSALAEEEYDLLLSDIGLPEVSGYDLIRKVRSLGAKVPAIAFTAYAADMDREAALAAGFQAHATKPIDTELLVKLVREFAARS